jgi:hypothetical protein
LQEWLAQNPDATDAEIARREREITVMLRGWSNETRDAAIRAWETGDTSIPAGTAVAGSLGNLPAAGDSKEGTALTSGTALTREEPAVPAGLEGVWDKLSDQEKGSALRMLNRGVTAAAILAALQGGG